MTTELITQLLASSWMDGGSAAYVEGLYEQYLRNPESLPTAWREAFSGLSKGTASSTKDYIHSEIREYFLQLTTQPKLSAHSLPQLGDAQQWVLRERKQARVQQLILAYRSAGHHAAELDPLRLSERQAVPHLSLSFHELSESDLNLQVANSDLKGLGSNPSLREIYDALQKVYCGSIGIEFMHITDYQQTSWIAEQFEPLRGQPQLSIEQKQELLKSLIAADGLEKYLGIKYVGQKRFSLEGGDALIPCIETIALAAVQNGVKEIVLGMAHRGRLNVLVNVLGKSPAELFEEFEGKYKKESGSGDVKYHKGFSADVLADGKKAHIALAFNPSHLEIINPVVEGSVRARQERRKDQTRDQVIPILVHGDAAFAGQGVVMETLNLSQSRGYSTGGTIHIVVNNQIGFTTSNPIDSRSTLYCTDVAKMVQAPIFHVNADDPESVWHVAKVAFDFRMRFKRDVVIDLVCYRRHGHNEADEPMMTQPLMYQVIRQHPPVKQIYANHLMSQGVISEAQIKEWEEQYRNKLDQGQIVARFATPGKGSDEFAIDWSAHYHQPLHNNADTKMSSAQLKALGETIFALPNSFELQPQVAREHQTREKMVNGQQPLNWGCAELLAYASLLKQQYNVRISGQDCGRGTFTHRQAVLHDQKTGAVHIGLQQVDKNAQFTIIDSVLSEEAVLGFEYGYATSAPNSLVIWEAQFGDFWNGAQVVMDQFICSGEQKWGRLCGLVMLLPHGYEGQGPEHTSGRLERFMQLAAQDNMQVCMPTTPAQIFHLLRRQMLSPSRKPLVVMTPKSILRYKLAVSTLDELANGKFNCVIPETQLSGKDSDIKRIILCSGKVYYDLLQFRSAENLNDTALVRVEQLYPWPTDEIAEQLARYSKANLIIWCQEEPANQGTWLFIRDNLEALLKDKQLLIPVMRDSAAAPAVGSLHVHQQEQQQLVKLAFTIKPSK